MAGKVLAGLVGLGWLAVPGNLGAAVAPGRAEARLNGCRGVTLNGEVRAGQGYKAAIGGGLEVRLQAIASGWILRVLPMDGPGGERNYGQHDYAELATPPYHSVTPLLISTDFSFRAQDAIGWNPREFRFATDRGAYLRLLAAYERLPAPGAAADPAREQELAGLLIDTATGKLRILDARLVAGTADQWKMAAAVAVHFSSTAHTLDQAGGASALGRIEWMRFELELALPGGFAVKQGLHASAEPCGF